jgi:hypothetical protein
MSNIKLEIAVSCSWFQKRLCWMLSSILQQKGDIPEIIFNVAYPKNNGNPSTEEVCKYFRNQGLNIIETVYEDEISMQKRGLVRNLQVSQTKADWILFADTDMAYHPLFFSDLKSKIKNELKDCDKCVCASRVSLDIEFCKKYFNIDDKNNYPCIIDNVDGIVSKWPIYWKTRPSGAGYFQLANVDVIKDKCKGLYVNPRRCKDAASVESYHKARSDMQFRQRIGGRIAIQTYPQYHLNHERDNELKCHLILQR